MRAIAMIDYDSGVALHELPAPRPAPNELLVRVRASSVNRIDVLVAGGVLKGMMEYEFPAVPGRDFAGTVEQVGAEVSRFEVGDDVFGFLTKPTVHEGAWAEYATVAEDGFVARKPSGLEFTEAAALPLAGVTALVSVDAVDPREGDTVLIVGADGGVGSYAVQLAAKRGATVIATAKPDDEQRLRDLGAAETIDYTREDIAAAVGAHHREGVSALIDFVNQADRFAPLADLVRVQHHGDERDGECRCECDGATCGARRWRRGQGHDRHRPGARRDARCDRAVRGRQARQNRHLSRMILGNAGLCCRSELGDRGATGAAAG